jgi:putative NIF3 family GTP cyclohydrolase 1 type 2
MKQRRLKTLLKHDISLLAYHLPLDLHPEVGNNVQLARQLDITVEGPLDPDNLKIVGLVGSLAEPMMRAILPAGSRKSWAASRCWSRAAR